MKIVARLLQLVLLVLGVLAVAWMAARFVPRTPAEQADLRALDAQWTPPGSDAFDDLWLVGYAVPPGKRRALVDADLGGPGALAQTGADAGDAARVAGFASVLPAPRAADLRCGNDEDCVEKVRRNPEAYRAARLRAAGLVRNLEGLRRHGHVRSRDPRLTGIPPYQWATGSDTWHALRFVEGEVDAAFADACADLAMWRRFAANNDTLIGTMVSVAGAERQAQLIAQMAARVPRGTPLPTQCTAALAAPAAAEGSVLHALVGERRYMAEISDVMVKQQAGWAAPLLFDPRDTDLRNARRAAYYASGPARAALAADRKLQPPDIEPQRDWRCIANLHGCVLFSVGAPAYAPYAWRLQDHRAHLQLMAALAWLQAQPATGEPLDRQLARWPGQWAPPARQVNGDPATGMLWIPHYDHARGDAWRVPAPGSRLSPGQGAAAAPAAAPLRRT